MNKRALFAGIAVLALLLLATYLWGPASVPAGQEPLRVLSNADLRDFAAAFERDEDAARLVLLLSPT